MTTSLTYDDVQAAKNRIAAHIRPVSVAPVDAGTFGAADGFLAYEFSQHTGSFKARGATNFTAAHVESMTMPDAGIVIASGGNAGLACAWAAQRHDIPATVFIPETAPPVKLAKLLKLGADVRQVGTEYAAALDASQKHAADTGALLCHAYDHPLMAAGAGTLLDEIRAALPGLDTVVVAVGGGGLFSGVAAAADAHGVRVVAVEPEHCRALNAALEAGHPVDVPVDSVAADSLGARSASSMAVRWARQADVRSVLVTDEAIIEARQALWDDRRVAVEHGAAAALAALRAGVYVPTAGERVCVVLCGANTDPGDLMST